MEGLSESILLAGPTAVGKSEVALALASQIGGEIISVDSMQVYRGLEVGTAKPSREERTRVRHHLIDVVGLEESFDAARFVRLAREAIKEIRGRNQRPILCGGTGLYFKALLEGLGDAPAGDARLRAELEATPLEKLLEELARTDPETFARIDRQNPRRVVRAVEVCRITGKPFSAQRAPWRTKGKVEVVPFFGITRRLEDLRQRIDARVEEMFRRGLIEETQELVKEGLEGNRTAVQALGYRQVLEYLRGARSLPETVELVKVRTRQYARRQQTWFRKQAELEWIEAGQGRSTAQLAEQIAEKTLFLASKDDKVGKGRKAASRAADAQD